jgi:hypothetical protein
VGELQLIRWFRILRPLVASNESDGFVFGTVKMLLTNPILLLVVVQAVSILPIITKSYGLLLPTMFRNPSTSYPKFRRSGHIICNRNVDIESNIFSNSTHVAKVRQSASEQKSRSRKRHFVRWENVDGIVVFEAIDGETLRTAALRRGMVSPHNGRAQLINCTCTI